MNHGWWDFWWIYAVPCWCWERYLWLRWVNVNDSLFMQWTELMFLYNFIALEDYYFNYKMANVWLRIDWILLYDDL